VIYNELYRKYFEYQAIKNPELLHTEDSKVFEMVSFDEAMGDFRTAVKGKASIIRLMNYTYRFYFSDQLNKIMVGGYFIGSYHSNRKGGSESFNAAMEKSEKINDMILKRMAVDSSAGHPLFHYSLNTLENVNSQPKVYAGDVGYSGYITTFPISALWDSCPDTPTDAGYGDGGKTPKQL